MTASVRHDGAWTTLAAVGLVAWDFITLSLGGVVAADTTLIPGDVLLDQSRLTGESVPIEAGAMITAQAVLAHPLMVIVKIAGARAWHIGKLAIAAAYRWNDRA